MKRTFGHALCPHHVSMVENAKMMVWITFVIVKKVLRETTVKWTKDLAHPVHVPTMQLVKIWKQISSAGALLVSAEKSVIKM